MSMWVLIEVTHDDVTDRRGHWLDVVAKYRELNLFSNQSRRGRCCTMADWWSKGKISPTPQQVLVFLAATDWLRWVMCSPCRCSVLRRVCGSKFRVVTSPITGIYSCNIIPRASYYVMIVKPRYVYRSDMSYHVWVLSPWLWNCSGTAASMGHSLSTTSLMPSKRFLRWWCLMSLHARHWLI